MTTAGLDWLLKYGSRIEFEYTLVILVPETRIELVFFIYSFAISYNLDIAERDNLATASIVIIKYQHVIECYFYVKILSFIGLCYMPQLNYFIYNFFYKFYCSLSLWFPSAFKYAWNAQSWKNVECVIYEWLK